MQYLPHGCLHLTCHRLAPVQPFVHGGQSRAGAQRAESGRKPASESDALQQLVQDSAQQVSNSRPGIDKDVHAEMQEMRTRIGSLDTKIGSLDTEMQEMRTSIDSATMPRVLSSWDTALRACGFPP